MELQQLCADQSFKAVWFVHLQPHLTALTGGHDVSWVGTADS